MIRSFIATTFLAAALSNGAAIGTATISQTTISPGEFQYDLMLTDTGATDIGTYWFAWVPGDNFMPVSPTSVVSPAGWQDIITSGGPSAGFAIQWTATSAANDLTSGNSLAFSFDSSLTLAQLQSPSTGTPSAPVDLGVIYIGAPLTDAGAQVIPSAVPEPSSLALAGLALTSLLLRRTRA